LKSLYFAIRVLIGLVWLINGLICKVLMLVPRHNEIVSKILGEKHALLLTHTIGIGEIALAIWIWSGLSPMRVRFKWN